MYTLLTQLYAKYNRKEEYSILILGLDDAGKTTFLEKLKSRNGAQSLSHDKITPTIGQNVGKFMYKGRRFQVWDLGGQSSLRSIWSNYFSSTHLILFLMDSSTPARLTESSTVLAGLLSDPSLETLPILVVANKQDVAGAMKVEDVKGAVARDFGRIDPGEGGVLGCSALTGDGVDEVMQWIETRVVRNNLERPPVLK